MASSSKCLGGWGGCMKEVEREGREDVGSWMNYFIKQHRLFS